jgi:hypothetical protein
MCEEKIQVYGKKSTGPRASKLFFFVCASRAVSLGSTLDGATSAYPGQYQVAPLMRSALNRGSSRAGPGQRSLSGRKQRHATAAL